MQKVRLIPFVPVILAIPLWVLLAGCTSAASPSASPASSTPAPLVTSTSQPSADQPVATIQAGGTPTVTPLPKTLGLDPANWVSWPVLPIVTQNVRTIYLHGQQLGNNPRAFSIFGDCQSHPDAFLGIYETDPARLKELPPELQQMVAYFAGSFDRESPTIKDGTTAGGLLSPLWHNGTFGCSVTETPVDCELRLHKPSFVFINVGTHWVVRNREYLRTIMTVLIERGVVPILVTKADEREQGQKTNADLANLAVELNVPVWNFYAALTDLPDLGLYAKPGQGGLGNVYLGDEATGRYQLGGLQVLYIVWQAAITQ
jgi:hypothetical protein